MGIKRANDEDDLPLCRCCAVPLLTSAEQKIGCHIRCVFEKKFSRVDIPTVGYRFGARRNGPAVPTEGK